MPPTANNNFCDFILFKFMEGIFQLWLLVEYENYNWSTLVIYKIFSSKEDDLWTELK